MIMDVIIMALNNINLVSEFEDKKTLKKINKAKKEVAEAEKEYTELQKKREKVLSDMFYIKDQIKGLTRKADVMGKTFTNKDISAYTTKLKSCKDELNLIDEKISKLSVNSKFDELKGLNSKFYNQTFINSELKLWELIKKMVEGEITAKNKKLLADLQKFIRSNPHAEKQILMKIRNPQVEKPDVEGT